MIPHQDSYEIPPMSNPIAPTGQSTAPKYIFVTGGVVSSLGKGIAAASL